MTYGAVVLDAMGVIYQVADDLRDLLIPFLRTQGCTLADDEIIDLYRACYRDGMPAAAFWQAVACDAAPETLEDGLMRLYELREGVVSFLSAMREHRIPVFGLSNDVAEWSLKRRHHFGLEEYFEAWVVSGAVGTFKPDSRIFELMIDLLPCDPPQALFVDDSRRNLEAAAALGFQTAHFTVEEGPAAQRITSFEDLQTLILQEPFPTG